MPFRFRCKELQLESESFLKFSALTSAQVIDCGTRGCGADLALVLLAVAALLTALVLSSQAPLPLDSLLGDRAQVAELLWERSVKLEQVRQQARAVQAEV